jgi:hypothetical protein
MSDVGRTKSRRTSARLLVAGGLLAATLLACGGPSPPVEVAVSGGLPPTPPPVAEPATRFQGSVASVEAGALIVDVRIVWTPVLKAEPHQRRVVVDPGTRWDRGMSLSDVRAGDEIQVDASEPVDGRWPALRVQLFDID